MMLEAVLLALGIDFIILGIALIHNPDEWIEEED